MSNRYTSGRLGAAARRRRAQHLHQLRLVARAEGDLRRAEAALRAARILAGLDVAA